MIEISIAAIAFTALAAVHAAQGRWPEAEREAERAEVLRRAPDRNVPHAHAQLVLAEIRMHRGRLARAATDLERARQEIDGFPDAGRLPAMVEGLQRSLDAALAESAPIELAEPPSGAELPVLRLLATPLSQREIGDSLFLSVNTVKSHTRELYRKLGVGSRDDAVARAVALELIDDAAPATQNARILGT
jgi:LuxR family maltose regulon positive regulatory protein